MSDKSMIQDFVDLATAKKDHIFYHYEPWDGPDGEEPRHTPGGSRFQKAMIKSVKYLRMALAGNQVGKTYGLAVEVVMMMTREIPYCFRYEEGVDTGIERMHDVSTRLGKDNVLRWGRRNVNTGVIIDHDPRVPNDPSWNCGNIVGLGPYPVEKLCTEVGQQSWVCTYKQARDDTWIDLFKALIPEHCLNKKRGTEGYSASEFIFFLQENMSIRIKTYEQGWERVESKKAHHIVLDEEPPDRRYYTGCIMHAVSLSFSFTPLRGWSWTYSDIYEKWVGGSQDIEVFHATKYDCPFNVTEEIEKQERQLKGYERDPKIYGKYGQQEGKPYYDYEICQQYIENFSPASVRLTAIYPVTPAKTVEEALKQKMVMRPRNEKGVDTWEVYEELRADQAYWISVDCGKGHDNPEEAQDPSAAYVFRAPIPTIGEDAEWPVCVAALHSSAETEVFSWLVLYAAIFYNGALLAPETKGEDGRAFLTEIKRYPFWFKMTVINNKTKKVTDNMGFDTNAKTRTPLFNKLRKWINAHETKSNIPHRALVIEQAKIIWLKGRPDHPSSGTSDCVVAWCLGLWVWEEARTQIRNNAKRFKENRSDHKGPNFSFLTDLNRCETKPILGSSNGMDRRQATKWQRKQNQRRSQQSQKKMQTFEKPETY